MLEIEEIIEKEFLMKNNKKVKNETLEKYLNSFTTKELTRLAILSSIIDHDYEESTKIQSFKQKKQIINHITNNLEKILKNYIKIIEIGMLDKLKIIIDYNLTKINQEENLLSIHFINILKQFSLAKIEYSPKDKSIKPFMPKEFIEILKKYLKDKNF